MLRTNDFAAKVRLHLIEIRAGTLLHELSTYIGQESGSVSTHWEATWRSASIACLRLAKWKDNVSSETEPLSAQSRAYIDAVDLCRMRDEIGHRCLDEAMSPEELQHMTGLCECLGDIAEIYGLVGSQPSSDDVAAGSLVGVADEPEEISPSEAARIARIARSLIAHAETGEVMASDEMADGYRLPVAIGSVASSARA